MRSSAWHSPFKTVDWVTPKNLKKTKNLSEIRLLKKLLMKRDERFT